MNEMSEKEALEQAIQNEQLLLERQQLLKRLWRLNQLEKSSPSLTETNRPENHAAPKKSAPQRRPCPSASI
jgi:hypothetical protein